MVNLTCAPVNLISQCDVIWNVCECIRMTVVPVHMRTYVYVKFLCTYLHIYLSLITALHCSIYVRICSYLCACICLRHSNPVDCLHIYVRTCMHTYYVGIYVSA